MLKTLLDSDGSMLSTAYDAEMLQRTRYGNCVGRVDDFFVSVVALSKQDFLSSVDRSYYPG